MDDSGPGGSDGAQAFPFPFAPYPIQQQLMQAIFDAIEERKIGIFESPTGTGKTLSIICSVLHWLRERAPPFPDSDEPKPSTAEAEPSWLDELDVTTEAERELRRAERRQRRLQRLQRRLRKAREQLNSASHLKRRRVTAGMWGVPGATAAAAAAVGGSAALTSSAAAPEDDARFVVAEYESDAEDGAAAQAAASATPSSGAAALRQLDRLLRTGGATDGWTSDNSTLESEAEEEAGEAEVAPTRVLYCSRTHSQLSQFVQEIHKTRFATDLRVVSLGSRKTLCINDAVRALGSASRMNDACLDMQRSTSTKCPHNSADLRRAFRDRGLAQVQDIEELVQAGRQMGACPYYGTREMLPWAELVTMPYSMLLHRGTREAVGVSVRGAVVVLDEAHNLVEAVNEAHSCHLSLTQVEAAHAQLSRYLARYQARLLGKNVYYIKQLLWLLRALGKQLAPPAAPAPVPAVPAAVSTDATTTAATTAGTAGAAGTTDRGDAPTTCQRRMLTINEFLLAADVDNVNLFAMERYLRRSDIAKKLRGFVEVEAQPAGAADCEPQAGHVKVHARTTSAARGGRRRGAGRQAARSPEFLKHASALLAVQALLNALTNAEPDGRVLLDTDEDGCPRVSFVMLNPAVHFRHVVEQARAVLLLGGTMAPVEEMMLQLFPSVPRQRVRSLTLGHVVPPENLLAVTVPSGPAGVRFNFSFRHRADGAQLAELGQLLANLSRVVPAGMVCFLPSFDFMATALTAWEASGALALLRKHKAVLSEPRSATEVERALKQFSDAAQAGGALLLSVVGGKLSEGINFADDLARCVIMVGLPYPNIRDPVLLEKLRHLDALSGAPVLTGGGLQGIGDAGRRHYHSMCMMAVNQSIGRAIRHKGDYAAILLVDERFQQPRVAGSLPAWIGHRLLSASEFGGAFGAVVRFFKAKGRIGR